MHAPVGERLSKKLPFDRNSVKLKFLLHLNQRNLQSEWSGTELRPPFADVPHGSARNARAPRSDTHRTAKTRCLSYRPICCRERRLPQAVSSLALRRHRLLGLRVAIGSVARSHGATDQRGARFITGSRHNRDADAASPAWHGSAPSLKIRWTRYSFCLRLARSSDDAQSARTDRRCFSPVA